MDLENMFCNWLPKRIVTKPVDTMFSKWRNFQFSDDDQSPNIEALQKAEKDLNAQQKFKEAAYWSRLYGGAKIILGMRDVLNSTDMAKPLDFNKVKKGDLKYMLVVDRWRCAPTGVLDEDVTSPNFGKPLTYKLAESSVEVHWTRMLHFDGELLPWQLWKQRGMWHDSSLQHVYDSLINYETSTSAICSMLFEANIDVVTTTGLTKLLGTKEGEQKVAKRFQLSQLVKSFNRTLILDGEEKYEKKQNQFSNIDKIWQQFMVDASAAAQIPVSILFGDQTGTGLSSAGDDDLTNWHNYCVDERNAKVQTQLDYFDQIFVRSVLGSYPDDYNSEWNPLGELDESAHADIELKRAQRDQIYLTTGVVTEGLVAGQLKVDGTYDNMSDEDVQLAEELSQQNDDFDAAQKDQQTQQGQQQLDQGEQQMEHSKVELAQKKKDLKNNDTKPKGNGGEA
jgi:phage-related protein (TIGR01555 family)